MLKIRLMIPNLIYEKMYYNQSDNYLLPMSKLQIEVFIRKKFGDF